MSKTYIYLLILIGVYLFIVKGLDMTETVETESGGGTTKGGRTYSGSGGTFSNNT